LSNNYQLFKTDILSKSSDISEVLGCTPLISASVRVTSRCQSRCCFCSTNSESSSLRFEEESSCNIVNWLRQLSFFGVQRLFITGGEPTLRSDIGQIIKGAKSLGFDVAMSTNGLNLNSKIIEELQNSGLKHLQISLHGIAETHDRLTGIYGAHESVINAIHLSTQSLENVSVAMTISLDNLCEVELVIEEALEAGAHWVAIHPVMAVGRAKADSVPKLKDVITVLDNLKDVNKEHVAVMLPPALVPSWAQNKRFGFGYVCTFPDMLAIDDHGRVAPCDTLLSDMNWQLGNIKTHPLDEILTSECSKQWRDLREDPVRNLGGVCKQCKFLQLCCGGCRALSYRKNGGWNLPDIWCEEAFDSGIFPESSLCKQ